MGIETDAVSRKEILSYIDRIQNQGTGKHKSLDFIQKYVENMQSVPTTDAVSREYLLSKAWDADTRIGFVQVVDVGDIEEAPSVTTVNCGSTVCDDAVSRSEAIEVIHRLLEPSLSNALRKKVFIGEELIKGLPSVTPRQNAGRWIDRIINYRIMYFCSECGESGNDGWKFCPHCGSMNRGEQE